MKIWGKISMIFGILLILINVLIYKANYETSTINLRMHGNILEAIAFYLGYNIFLILGIFLVLLPRVRKSNDDKQK